MIIGEQFGWAHLPRTGGTATQWMFRLFPEWADGHTGMKHSAFADHAAEIEGKTLVSNLRRLPDWMLSWGHHRRSDYRPDDDVPRMKSPWQMSESHRADFQLGLMLDEGRFEVDRWLRMEHLTADFTEFISQYREVTDVQRRQIEEIGPVNAVKYDHDVTHWFTPAHVERMYELNPRWAEIERRVYGDIALLA